MGILGKVVGAGLGFMVGGPLGAVLGGSLGHQYDAAQTTRQNKRKFIGAGQQSMQDYQAIFMVSLISMAAKISKADGHVSAAEISVLDDFLKNELRLSAQERQTASRIFNQAKQYHGDYADFAREFHTISSGNHQLLVTMLHLLFRIAASDAQVNPAEQEMIHNIARIFNLSAGEFDQIKSFYIKETSGSYKILGCTPASSDEEIKKAYRKLAHEYHPDKILAKGLPEDFVKFANQKLKEINEAYDRIKKERAIA